MDTIRSKDGLSAVKTDLRLLLECLKFQMKCPDLQKQALLTIQSICEKRDDNVDLLREMGGVTFVYNLSKSSIVGSDVKETALFTLGTLAESSVYCKNFLCRKETFVDLAGRLMNEDIPLTQKRVSVYLLSVLVVNNKSGQTLVQNTGCLDVLLELFRTASPLSTEATSRSVNATQTLQLWASVSSALCGCVNNPQNEAAQRICVEAFPMIKVWLQQIALPRTEIFQPICSFIAMTVANNSCVQETFSALGCLDSLTLALVRLASAADTSLLSCQISVTISKTLSACITENYSLASGLAQYDVVSHLILLLASPHLDPEDRLSILLTLGHCTEASEEHQSQLVQCGGLPLIITLVTEDTSEEVRKAASFILQTCKQATMSLGVPGLKMSHGQSENVEALTNLKGVRSSASELLRRIDLLEKRQAKEAGGEQADTESLCSNEVLGQPSLPPSLRLKRSIKAIPTTQRQNSTLKYEDSRSDNNIDLQNVRRMMENQNDSGLKHTSSGLRVQEEKTKTSERAALCSVCHGTGSSMSSHLQSLEGGREPPTAANQLFKRPAPVRHSVPKEMNCTDKQELQDSERRKVVKIPVEKHSLSHIRCAGCVLPFEEVTSRTFASLQSSCRHSCDMHKVLQEATEQFRIRHCNLLCRREYQDDPVEQTDSEPERVSSAEPQRSREKWNNSIVKDFWLTPKRKVAMKGNRTPPKPHWKRSHGITLTPLHRAAGKEEDEAERRDEERNRGKHPHDDELRTCTAHCSTRRKRRDFSSEEVSYLLCGVKTYGSSWNSILWSYPFQPGRTNVDLAKKYRRLIGQEQKNI